MKRGEKTPEARKRYKQLQRRKKRYMELREELQLAGVIPVEPNGAIRDERTSGSLGPALPEIVRQGLRESWATPDTAKPAIIAALLEPFYADEVLLDKEGSQVRVKPSSKSLKELADTLRMLDQTQYERDHPEEAARGGVKVAVLNNTQNLVSSDVFTDIEKRLRIIEQVDCTATGGIRPDCDVQSVDETQPHTPKAESEADRVPDA